VLCIAGKTVLQNMQSGVTGIVLSNFTAEEELMYVYTHTKHILNMFCCSINIMLWKGIKMGWDWLLYTADVNALSVNNTHTCLKPVLPFVLKSLTSL
jgi:hypothetical protein